MAEENSFNIRLSAQSNANLDLITSHAARANPAPGDENDVTLAFGDGNMPKMNHVLTFFIFSILPIDDVLFDLLRSKLVIL